PFVRLRRVEHPDHGDAATRVDHDAATWIVRRDVLHVHLGGEGCLVGGPEGESHHEDGEEGSTEGEAWVAPHRLPEGDPPRFANWPGLPRYDTRAHRRPEAPPARLGPRGDGLAHHRAQAGQLLGGIMAGGASRKVAGDEAGRARAECAVGVALETASNHCAAQAPHVRSIPPRSWTSGGP